MSTVDRDRNVIIPLDSGENLGIRIDNWVLKQTQKKAGCKGMIDMLQRIGIDDGNIDNEVFVILLMEAINEYNYHQKTGMPEVTERQASDYIDQMGGIILALAKISVSFEQFIPKNSAPPQMAGERIIQ